MSDDAKAKATTLFGRVIHSADEWKAIEDEATQTKSALAERERELAERERALAELQGERDTLARLLADLEKSLEQERSRGEKARSRAEQVEAELGALRATWDDQKGAAVAAREAELERKWQQEAKNAAAAREKAQSALDRAAQRALDAEARARALAVELEDAAKAHAAKVEQVIQSSEAKLEQLAKENAAELDALAMERSENAAVVAAKSAELEAALAELDALRARLAAAVEDAAQATRRHNVAQEALQVRLRMSEAEASRAAAEAEAGRERVRAGAALACRVVRDLASTLEAVHGDGGAALVWRWSVAARADDLAGLIEALGVGTGASFEREAGGGVLVFRPTDGEVPAWLVTLVEAVFAVELGGARAVQSRGASGEVVIRVGVEEPRLALEASDASPLPG